MNIRHRSDVFVIQWPHSYIFHDEDENEKDEQENHDLLNALNNEHALKITPSYQDYIQHGSFYRHRKNNNKTTGGAADEDEEDEAGWSSSIDDDDDDDTNISFPDLRDVPFLISQLAWNYVDQSVSARSIKKSALHRLFEDEIDFKVKKWMQIEEKVVRSIIESFEDVQGDHGVFTIHWVLRATESKSLEVIKEGKEIASMSSFLTLDEWPSDIVWFRTILDIEQSSSMFPFKTCTFNFLVSQKEELVFAWTSAEITKEQAFDNLVSFFTEVAFVPIVEKEGTGPWKFVFVRSFHTIISQNDVVHELLNKLSTNAKYIAQGAFEFAVDVRMIHSLFQQTGFRSSFQSGSFLHDFVSSVLKKKHNKNHSNYEEIPARKGWKQMLHLGTYRNQGVSLPMFTAFVYKACTQSKDSTNLLDDMSEGDDEEEGDTIQELISHQLDVAESWNRSRTISSDAKVKIVSLTVDVENEGKGKRKKESLNSCFLLGLLDSGESDVSIVESFGHDELAVEEKLRLLFPNMFFVNELSVFYRKIVEIETNLREEDDSKWIMFLVPVILCRKPSSVDDSALSDSLFLWQTYGECAFHILIGRMKPSVEGFNDPENASDYSFGIIHLFPYEPEVSSILTAWKLYISQAKMEVLFPLQQEMVFEEDGEIEVHDEERSAEMETSDDHHLDLLIEGLNQSFLCLQSNEDLISPFAWSWLENDDLDHFSEEEFES